MKTIDIKGKDYIMVNERVKEFHKLYNNGRIESEIIKMSDGVVVIQTKIFPDVSNLERFFTGVAYEKEDSTFINKTSYIENCETSSVGRALGFLGIGIDASIASAEEIINAVNNQTGSSVVSKVKQAFPDSKVVSTQEEYKGKVLDIKEGKNKQGKPFFAYKIFDETIKQEITIRYNFKSVEIGDSVKFTGIKKYGDYVLYANKAFKIKESSENLSDLEKTMEENRAFIGDKVIPDDSHDVRETDAQIASENQVPEVIEDSTEELVF